MNPSPPAAAVAPVASPALSRRSVRRFSAVELLVVLVLWMVSAPFVMGTRYGNSIETVVATVVMLSAVVAVGGSRRTLLAAAILVTPACVCRWVNHLHPELMPSQVHATAAIVFMAFVVVHLLRFILRAPQVNVEVLCAGISSYLLIGILWAFIYILLAATVPNSFSFSNAPRSDQEMIGLNALYFSFVTLSTIGYGDITPTLPAARMFAIVEATMGMFYVTILIARLVSLYSSAKPASGGPGEAER